MEKLKKIEKVEKVVNTEKVNKIKNNEIELSIVINDLSVMIEKLKNLSVDSKDSKDITQLITELIDHYKELSKYNSDLNTELNNSDTELNNSENILRNIALRQMYGLPIDPKYKFKQ